MSDKHCESRLLLGVCCDCGKPLKKWTQEEIDAAKEDMGMTEDDDLFYCCDECMNQYMPSSAA